MYFNTKNSVLFMHVRNLFFLYQAHGRAILLSVYKSEMDKRAAALSSPLRTVLLHLVDLYVTYWALEKVGDMLLVRDFFLVRFAYYFYVKRKC